MRMSSSALQKVPSRRSTSQESSCLTNLASSRGTAGIKARRLPEGDSTIAPSDDSSGDSCDLRGAETYAGKCVPRGSVRQRNPESSPSGPERLKLEPGVNSIQLT